MEVSYSAASVPWLQLVRPAAQASGAAWQQCSRARQLLTWDVLLVHAKVGAAVLHKRAALNKRAWVQQCQQPLPAGGSRCSQHEALACLVTPFIISTGLCGLTIMSTLRHSKPAGACRYRVASKASVLARHMHILHMFLVNIAAVPIGVRLDPLLLI